MKTCPACQQAYPDDVEHCARDLIGLTPEVHRERECRCTRRILGKARVCKHCGRDVEPLDATRIAVQVPFPASLPYRTCIVKQGSQTVHGPDSTEGCIDWIMERQGTGIGLSHGGYEIGVWSLWGSN